MLCHNNSNMTDIEQYLKNLLIEFEVHKSEFSPSNRHLLRQRFTHLVQQCKYQNASKEIISLGMTLADHAYKLPERMYINTTGQYLYGSFMIRFK